MIKSWEGERRRTEGSRAKKEDSRGKQDKNHQIVHCHPTRRNKKGLGERGYA